MEKTHFIQEVALVVLETKIANAFLFSVLPQSMKK
jgi:hypothetical protein